MIFAITRGLRLAFLVAAACTLAGCSSITHKPLLAQDAGTPRTIAIFFDGTANDEKSDTNVKRLHSLVTLQAKEDIASLYVEGVGTGTDDLGMTLGVGTEARVLIAYEFILNNYHPGDRIFIFGFSRGAYAGRILTSLLYHAGVVAVPGIPNTEIAETVYGLVKEVRPPHTERDRRRDVQAALRDRFARNFDPPLVAIEPPDLFEPVPVEMLGLWDSVEALGYREGFSKLAHKLGIAEHKVNVDNANARYGDKLCNVLQVRHAMSIDDNREWIFTPRLMTRGFLFDDCDPKHPSKLLTAAGDVDRTRLKEVWFAGAHSDVGGGYQGSSLSGVSLNWMLEEIEQLAYRLVPKGARVRQDAHGTSHDPESGMLSPLYHSMNRDLAGYALDTETVPAYRGTLCVHPTVFERRKMASPKEHENGQLALTGEGPVCLIENEPPVPGVEARYRQRRDDPHSNDAGRFCRAILNVQQAPCEGKRP